MEQRQKTYSPYFLLVTVASAVFAGLTYHASNKQATALLAQVEVSNKQAIALSQQVDILTEQSTILRAANRPVIHFSVDSVKYSKGRAKVILTDISHMAYSQGRPEMSNGSIPSSDRSVNDTCGGLMSFRAPSGPDRTVILPETSSIGAFGAGGGRRSPSPPRPLVISPCAAVIPAPLRVA